MTIRALQEVLDAIDARQRAAPDRGTVARYIPQLAGVAPSNFGMSVCLADGRQFGTGDAAAEFSTQSVSKVFTLAIALGRYGTEFWKRVGREPSSNVFNSVQELEVRNGIPANPFVNAGAIVTTDALLSGQSPKETLAEILTFIRLAASDEGIFVDAAVAASEQATGDRNRSIAYYLKSCGNLHHRCDLTLGTYFHHCAITMSCEQLARFGRFLAGFHPSGTLLSPANVRSINTLMATCGHYDGSGEFAVRVGVPAKSGVGGGILAIVPGYASIAVWSPGLDRFGNSLLGTTALAELSEALNLSVYTIGQPAPCA